MVNVIKLRKGLDIRLKGVAGHQDVPVRRGSDFALCPADYQGVTPKVVVKEGDRVLAGDALFVNKQFPDIRFASPVSGMVTGVVRGERRKVLAVTVKADDAIEYRDFGKSDISNEEAFQMGISALSKIQKVFVGINPDEEDALGGLKDATVTVFKGKCPAGNVGVQVNNIAPVNKGETVWTVNPTAVIFIGRLFLTGKVDMRHKVALAGQNVKNPAYSEILVGQKVETLVEGRVDLDGTRLINGNPLTGVKVTKDDYIGPHVSEVTAIPEGDHADEMLGWILPRTNQFSANRSYFSWLMPKSREYDCDARFKGGERHMIMSGEYDKVLPMDIYGEYLIKAIITGDIDRQEALGIYEVSPEDFAVAEFVDSSKLQLQRIVREGLDILRKENA